MLELALAAAERAPGSEGGILGATLAAFAALSLDQRDVAIGVLEAAARAAPKSWQVVIAPALVKGDQHAVARALAAARAAGLVDWVAHAFEATYWRMIHAGVGTPDLKAEALAGGEAAFDAALAASPGFVGLLELARLAVGDPERVAKVRATRQTSVALYLAATEARADVPKARAQLEAGLRDASPFESAFMRAHFELEAGEPGRALPLAEVAVRAAGPGERAAAEAFALRLAFNAPGPKLGARALSWLAVPADPMVLEAPYRGQYLVRLYGVTRADPELALAVQEALLGEPTARWGTNLAEVKAARRATLAKLGRWDEADDWVLASRRDAGVGRPLAVELWSETRTGIEAAMVTLNQEGPERMLRFAARLHPDELQRREVMGDLARSLIWRQEPYRARRLVERILSLPEGEGIGSARLLALAQDLLDAGRLDLAARAFERVVALGERSPKVYAGWLRALLRAGDGAKADEIAARAIEARPRRDARAVEELAKVFVEEGRLGRGIEILSARLGDGERMEPTTFNLIVESLARAGRNDELTPLARRFIESDPRGSQRLQGQAATRLMEVGALDAAQHIIEEALATRKRDPQLLTLATTLALARAAADAEAVADRLLKRRAARSMCGIGWWATCAGARARRRRRGSSRAGSSDLRARLGCSSCAGACSSWRGRVRRRSWTSPRRSRGRPRQRTCSMWSSRCSCACRTSSGWPRSRRGRWRWCRGAPIRR